MSRRPDAEHSGRGPVLLNAQLARRFQKKIGTGVWKCVRRNFKTERDVNTTKAIQGVEVGNGPDEACDSLQQWVPFYTQLKSTSDKNLGKEDDQFIDLRLVV